MNKYFDEAKIEELYPEAGPYMLPAQLVWKLPAGKEGKLAEVSSSGDYFLEEKVDGAWYQYVKTEHNSYLFARTTSKVTGLLTEKVASIPHINESLSIIPKNTILIGEIFVPGGTSKDVTHIMGCKPEEAVRRQNKEGLIHYYVHDIIFYDGTDLTQHGSLQRYEILRDMWNNLYLDQYEFLHLANVQFDNFEEHISTILARGGEGVVMKRKEATYDPGSRHAWDSIKIKQTDSADLICMGFCDATKEYTGKELDTWQYWEDGIPVTKPYALGWKTAIKVGCYDAVGKLVEIGTVSSGLTDELREAFSKEPEKYLGRVVELDCMSLDKKGHTLRHPTFKRFRDDKNPQECTLSMVFA